MKIGIYGGSFNPVHFGHTGLARWVAEYTDLDEVWMLVSPNNPLKDSHILADEQVRLEQVRKAVADIPHVQASDFEFHLPRPSYTANTLRALSRTYPEHTFTLIIGEDNLVIFDRWREWEYILTHYRLFVYPRHNAQCTMHNAQCTMNGTTERLANIVKKDTGQDIRGIVFLKDAPYFDISSTEIRNAKK